MGIKGCYIFLSILNAATMIPTVFFFEERSVRLDTHKPPITTREMLRELLAPLKYPDFRWVFFTRLLMNMGVYSVQEFLQYYVKDEVPVSGWSPTKEVSILFIPLLLAGVFAAFYCGRLSDKYGTRKKFVYVSGFGMSGSCFALMITSALSIKSFFLTFIVAIVFGAAFGTFGVQTRVLIWYTLLGTVFVRNIQNVN